MSQATIYLSNTALSDPEGTPAGRKFVDQWGPSVRQQSILRLEEDIARDGQVLQRKWSDVASELKKRELRRIANRIAALELDKSA